MLRNLRITVAYGHLANAFAQRVPGGANWCTFATWASKQAGCTIRREDVARAVERHFRSRLDKRPLGRQLARLPGLSTEVLVKLVGQVSLALPGIDRAAGAVARGNRKVFEEIGRDFAGALESLDQHAGSFEPMAATLRPGPPPDGQDLLRRAFLNYQAAAATADAAVRAQATLLANVQIGLHEQTRLQPEIREAMDAALLDVAEVRREILDRLAALVPGSFRSGLVKDAINALVDDLAQEVRSVCAGRDHRADDDHRPAARPDAAARLRSDAALSGHAEGADQRRAGDARRRLRSDARQHQGSGAIDWAVLEQRMRFITDFFRSSHDDDSLHEAPFPRAALDAIAAGRMPDLSGVVLTGLVNLILLHPGEIDGAGRSGSPTPAAPISPRSSRRAWPARAHRSGGRPVRHAPP